MRPRPPVYQRWSWVQQSRTQDGDPPWPSRWKSRSPRRPVSLPAGPMALPKPRRAAVSGPAGPFREGGRTELAPEPRWGPATCGEGVGAESTNSRRPPGRRRPGRRRQRPTPMRGPLRGELAERPLARHCGPGHSAAQFPSPSLVVAPPWPCDGAANPPGQQRRGPFFSCPRRGRSEVRRRRAVRRRAGPTSPAAIGAAPEAESPPRPLASTESARTSPARIALGTRTAPVRPARTAGDWETPPHEIPWTWRAPGRALREPARCELPGCARRRPRFVPQARRGSPASRGRSM